ncbi:MAG: type III secretion system chaperone [Planctomycetota bacterium]|jgi:hypothetical protein|nr:type III secretion system chaperone [Planctomycetota bacterium]
MPVLSALIGQLGVALGLDSLELEDGRQCSLVFNDARRVTIDYSPENREVIFSGVIGPASRYQSEAGCRRLLSMSLLGVETGGAAFGLAEDTDELLLWKRFDDAFADATDIVRALESFYARMEYCAATLNDVTNVVSKPDDAQPGTQPYMGMRV